MGQNHSCGEPALIPVDGITEIAGGGWKRGARAMISLMLAGAVFAGLALGVLVAYGICVGFFRLMRVHAESAARGRGAVAAVSVVSKS
jgi:hypothetical protein